jgi:glycosyltransferase involved in cell wall biosynthesis
MQISPPIHNTILAGEVLRKNREIENTKRGLKVLFLACYFPPVQGSASVRTWNIAKHLARLEWNVTVVTPDPSVWRTIEDSNTVSRKLERENIRRIFTDYKWRFLYPGAFKCSDGIAGWAIGGTFRRIARYFGIDNGIGWIREAESACKSLSQNDVDVILATAPPFSAFVVARRLSKRLNCPYVLDYRDPWVFHRGSRLTKLNSTRKRERKLIDDCAAVTVISESLLKETCMDKSKLHVVTNGYDPAELDQVKPYDFGHFSIVYAGVFRPPMTVITPIIEALKRLKEKSTARSIQWKFHYYGPHGQHVHEEAQRFEIMDKVVIQGRVSHAEALSAVRGSNITIVIASVLEIRAEWERGVVTGKLFEPIGMNVPVLLIGPAGVDLDSIIDTTGLARKVTADNIDGMLAFIEEVMLGKVPLARHPDVYAWPNIIRKLDMVLRNAVEQKLH